MPSYAIKSSGIRQVAANTLIGNSTGSTGSAEELSATDAKTLLGLGSSDSPTFAGLTIDEDSSYSIGVSKIAYKSGGGGTKARISVSNVTELELTGSKLAVGSGHSIGFASTSYADSGFLDTVLYRDGAGVIAQRNGTNAQSFRIYNTDDGSQTNYERLKVGWSGNDAIIGTERAGTGSTRTLQLQLAGSNRLEITGTWIDLEHCRPFTDGTKYFGYSTNRWKVGYWGGNTVTTSTPIFDGTQTWNDGAVSFTGILANITNTASAANSKLIDLQVGGTTEFSVDKEGDMVIGNMTISTSGGTQQTITAVGDHLVLAADNANNRLLLHKDKGELQTTFGGFDVTFAAEADNVWAQRNGTNAQTFRIYNTYTDASNYQRLKIGWSSSGAIIGTENAGTSIATGLKFQIAGATKLVIGGTRIDLISSRPDTDGTRWFGEPAKRWAVGWFNQLDQEIYTATDVGHILKGAASQSADLAQYQNSAGTVMTKIESDGSIDTTGNITATGSIAVGGQTGGAILEADAANTLAQRNGTDAQAFNIYNKYTDASNYQRLKFGWSSSVPFIGTENAGAYPATGINFNIAGTTKLQISGTWMYLRASCQPDTNGTRWFGDSTKRWALGYWGGNTVTTSTPIFDGTQTNTASSGDIIGIQFAPTYNQTGTAGGTDILVNRMEQAVGSGEQNLLDLQVGGTSKFKVDNAGGVSMPNLPTSDPASAGELWNDSGTLKISAG